MYPWSSAFPLRIAVAALCLAAAACAGGDGDGDGSGDLPPSMDASSALDCEAATGEADPFELRIGHRDGVNESYVELSDGGGVPLVLGYQGFYMLLLELEAALPVDRDSVCMRCSAELSPSTSTSFDRTSQSALVPFDVIGSGVFRGPLTFIVGSGNDRPKFDGAEVTLSTSCSREGLSGSVERALTLQPD